MTEFSAKTHLISRWQSRFLRAITTLDNYKARERLREGTKSRLTPLHVDAVYLRRSHGWPRTKKATAIPANWEENWSEVEMRKPLSTIKNKEFTLSFWKLQIFMAKKREFRILSGPQLQTVSLSAIKKKYKEWRNRSKQKYCWKEKQGTGKRISYLTLAPAQGMERLPKLQGYIVVSWRFCLVEFSTSIFRLVQLCKYILKQWPQNHNPLIYEKKMLTFFICIFNLTLKTSNLLIYSKLYILQ